MLSFILKFFFHNRKRTYQAVLALTLGLIIFISTSLLVRGYGNNISGIASIISASNRLVIFERGKTLSESKIDVDVVDFLYDYQEEVPNIKSILPQIYYPLDIINSNNETKETHIRFVNMTLFEIFQKHKYRYSLQALGENEVIVGQQLAYMLSVGRGSTVQLISNNGNLNRTATVANIIESGQEYDIEVLASLNLIVNISEIKYYSFIELQLYESKTVPQIKEAILKNCDNVEVMEEKQTQNFIRYATDEVIKTLNLLQIMFFVLMLITITYSIFTLVKESEEEIIVLRSIGATNFQIIFLFMAQALLVGIISAILGLLIGYFGVCFLVGLISSSTGFPYIALGLPFSLILSVSIFSLSLSVLSGILPAFIAAKIRVKIEGI